MRAIWSLSTIGFGLVAATAAMAQFANPNAGGPQNAAANPAGGANAGDVSIDPLFAAIDTDGDGVITKKELGKAVAALKKLDADKDGNITLAEIAAARAAGGGAAANVPGQGAANLQGQGGNNVPGPIGGNGQNVPTGSYSANGDANQATGRIMQMDANHDGMLTRDELGPQMWNNLRTADQDRNGVIDARELAMWAEQMGRRANAMQGQAIGQQNAGQQMPGGTNVPGRGRQPRP